MELTRIFAHGNKPINVRYQHTARQQRENESVRAYSADMLQRIEDCHMESEETRILTYLSGLKPNIKIELSRMEFNTLPQLVSCAERAENSLYLQNQYSNDLATVSTRKSRKDFKKKNNYPNKKRSNSKASHRSKSNNNRSEERSRSQSKNRSASQSAKDKPKRSKSVASIQDGSTTECDDDLN